MQTEESTPLAVKEEEEAATSEAVKKPLSHAKLSALSKARSAKLLKQQQKNYHEEMTMTTLNNIYEKLNMIDTKLYSLGKRTAEPLNVVAPAAAPEPKKQKTEETVDFNRSFFTYVPTIGLFIASSVLSRYASQQLRRFWMDRNNTTSDRDTLNWSWMSNDTS